MKTSRSSTGLSILAGGLTFVGAVGGTDLLCNGSLDDTIGTGWTGYFNTYTFADNYYRGPQSPASESPGNNYSWQHGVASGDYSGPCVQSVNVASALSAADIDAG